MKKSIIILLASIMCLCAQAQITNRIWGLTLGVSTKQQVLNAINSHHLIIKDRTTNQITAYSRNDFKFGGESWDFAFFGFFNGKLKAVGFASTNGDENMFNRLKSSLDDKYYYCEISEDINPYGESTIFYDDDDTRLAIYYDYSDDLVIIKYINLALQEKEDIKNASEL